MTKMITVLFLMCACCGEANEASRIWLTSVELNGNLPEPYKTVSLSVNLSATNSSIEAMRLKINNREVAIPKEYYSSSRVSIVPLWSIEFYQEIYRTTEGARRSDSKDYLSINFNSWEYDFKEGLQVRSRQYRNHITVLLDEYKCLPLQQTLKNDSNNPTTQQSPAGDILKAPPEDCPGAR